LALFSKDVNEQTLMKSLPYIVAIHLLLFVVPAYSQSTSKPCPAVTAKNKQEALMMEATTDKKGCWVRNKGGNLVFVSSASPDSNYKPVLPNPQTNNGRPKLDDPTVGLVGKGDLAGEWNVGLTYFEIDNGDDLLCRAYTYQNYTYAEEKGRLVVGWDHVPQWKCNSGCSIHGFPAFAAFPAYEPEEEHPPAIHLNAAGAGTYTAEASQSEMADFRIYYYDPQKFRRTISKYAYKIVVTGNSLTGLFTRSEDQSAQNGHPQVVCAQYVYRGERILPTKP
jgi:hypothetical protein